MLCLFNAGQLLERQDRVNPQLPWGQLLMGPEHARSYRPRTLGLAPTQLVQREVDEFYFPELLERHLPARSYGAALFITASEASVADWVATDSIHCSVHEWTRDMLSTASEA